MTERQKRQRGVLVVDPHHGTAGHDVARHVAVGEHHPLGLPGGARRVDDRGQLVRGDGGGAFLVLPAEAVFRHQPAVAALGGFGEAQLLVSGRALTARRRSRGAIHDHHRGQVLELVPHRTYLGRLHLVGHHHDPGAGIGENVADLPLGQRRVYRRGDRPGGERRKVGDDPFRTAVGHDRNPVARLHPERSETETDIANPVEELLRRKLLDGIAPTPAHEGGLGVAAGDVKRQCGQRLQFIVHGNSPACGGNPHNSGSHALDFKGRSSRRTGLLFSSPVLSNR